MIESVKKVRETKSVFEGLDKRVLFESIRRHREGVDAKKKQIEVMEQTVSMVRKKNSTLGAELGEIEKRREGVNSTCFNIERSVFKKAEALASMEDEINSLEINLQEIVEVKEALEREINIKT